MAWPRLEHYFAPTSERRRSSNPLPRQNISPNSTSMSASHSPTLKQTAEETLSLLPGILSCRPDAQPRSYLSTPANTPPLSSPSSPPPQSNSNSQNPTHIRVLNADSIDAALSLPVPLHYVPNPNSHHPKPPCILNMANGHHGRRRLPARRPRARRGAVLPHIAVPQPQTPVLPAPGPRRHLLAAHPRHPPESQPGARPARSHQARGAGDAECGLGRGGVSPRSVR